MISNDVILISLGCLHCQKKVDLIHHLWSHFFWQWSQWWESAKVMSKVEKEGRAWAQKFKSSKNAVIEMRHTHSLRRRRCPTQPHKTVIPCLHPISKHDQKNHPKFTSNFGYILKVSELKIWVKIGPLCSRKFLDANDWSLLFIVKLQKCYKKWNETDSLSLSAWLEMLWMTWSLVYKKRLKEIYEWDKSWRTYP